MSDGCEVQLLVEDLSETPRDTAGARLLAMGSRRVDNTAFIAVFFPSKNRLIQWHSCLQTWSRLKDALCHTSPVMKRSHNQITRRPL